MASAAETRTALEKSQKSLASLRAKVKAGGQKVASRRKKTSALDKEANNPSWLSVWGASQLAFGANPGFVDDNLFGFVVGDETILPASISERGLFNDDVGVGERVKDTLTNAVALTPRNPLSFIMGGFVGYRVVTGRKRIFGKNILPDIGAILSGRRT